MVTEKDWLESIRELLERELTLSPSLSSEFGISTHCELPYAREILTYDEANDILSPAKDGDHEMRYETDLLIYEEVQKKIKPRIIIEAKFYRPINTHDSIVYSHKAAQHKAVTPYLRYGIMLGCMQQHHPLPGRLFRHGVNFDFMISFKEAKPTSTEKASLVKLINSEWISSKKIEEMIFESRSRNRKRYFMLQNALQLEEIRD